MTLLTFLLPPLLCHVAAADPGTAFSYQGRLQNAGIPVLNNVDLRFTLYDSATSPTVVAGPINVSSHAWPDGIIETDLDFGDVFDGSPRWLGIEVANPSGGSFISLDPRVELKPASYSIYAENAGTAQNVLNDAVDDADADPTNERNTALSLNGTNLELTDAGGTLSADLSGLTGSFGDAHSLDAADGSPVDAVFVDADGRVGVGSNKPTAGLSVSSSSPSGSFSLRQLAAAQDEVGAFTRLSSPQDLVVSNQKAFITSRVDDTLSIIDISNPMAPALLGEAVDGAGFTNLNNVQSVFVSNNRAYVIGGTSLDAMTIIDVSDPTAPAQLGVAANGVGGISGLTDARALFVSGNRAYVGASSTLIILDVSNPAAPLQLGAAVSGVGTITHMVTPSDVFVSGGTAFVSSLDNSVTILDVSNPATPTQLSVLVDDIAGFNDLSFPTALHVDGGICYVVSLLDSAVSMIDVSIPATPALLGVAKEGVGDFTELQGAAHIDVVGSIAYVTAVTDDAVTMIDVSDPANPALIATAKDGTGTFDALNKPLEIAVSGDSVLVAAEDDDALCVLGLSPGNLGLEVVGDTLLRNDLDVRGNAIIGGSVGIGTEASDPLTVAGTIQAELPDNGGVSSYIRMGEPNGNVEVDMKDGASRYHIKIADSGNFHIEREGNGGIPGISTDPLGQVGIGIDAPDTILHSYSPFQGEQGGLKISQGSSNSVIYHNSNSDLILRKFNQTDQLVLDSGGDVGIGTSTPSSKLEVNGTVTASAFSGDGSGLSGVHNTNFTLNNTSLELTDGDGVLSADLSPLAGSAFGDGHSLDAADGTPADVVYVDALGRTGIGNTAPYAPLHVGPLGGSVVPVPVQLGTVVDGVGSFTSLNRASAVFVEGTTAYVTSEDDASLTIVDITDRSNPTLLGVATDGVGGFTDLAGANSVVVAGGVAYVTAGADSALTMIDVSVPASPSQLGVAKDGVGVFTSLGGARDVFVSGSVAYVAAEADDALNLIDVSDPANPALHSIAPLPLDGASSVFVLGTTAYVTADTADTLSILDVSNPASPSLLGVAEDGVNGFDGLNGAYDVFVQGTIAYVAAFNDSTLSCIDVSNPAAPVQLGVARDNVGGFPHLFQAANIVVVGNIAYVASEGNDSLTLIDVSDPTIPAPISVARDNDGTFDALDGARYVEVDSGYIYVASLLDDSLTIMETVSEPPTGLLVENSLQVNGNLQMGGSLQVAGTSPAPGLVLMATDTSGNLEYSKPIFQDSTFNAAEYVVDAGLTSTYVDLGPTTTLSLQAGQKVLLMVSFSFEIRGGSGTDDVKFRFSSPAGDCPAISEAGTNTLEHFDQHRDQWQSVSFHRVVGVTCDGEYQFRLQVDTSTSDDELVARYVQITAIAL